MKKMRKEDEGPREELQDTAEGGREDLTNYKTPSKQPIANPVTGPKGPTAGTRSGTYQDMGSGMVKGAPQSGMMSTNRGHASCVPCLEKHPVKSLAKSGRGTRGQE